MEWDEGIKEYFSKLFIVSHILRVIKVRLNVSVVSINVPTIIERNSGAIFNSDFLSEAPLLRLKLLACNEDIITKHLLRHPH